MRKTPIDMDKKREIAARIKKIRKEARLSQQEFADRLSISRTHSNYIESPKKEVMPSDTLLLRICDEFEINFKWLTTGEGEQKIIKKIAKASDFIKKEHALLKQTKEYFDFRASSLLEDLDLENEEFPEYYHFYKDATNLVLEISDNMKISHINGTPLPEELIEDYIKRFKKIIKKKN